ncbi:unnamed protein product [Clonostachys rhizophaga]|uniref:Uncharacterized protein n=1 Tax=Clonostachys rhizophaga TaxID=160324 RepID=A0A9N9VVN5_9HYPO|nr:unnamed protein product [Clonostachys rhizophaga]
MGGSKRGARAFRVVKVPQHSRPISQASSLITWQSHIVPATQLLQWKPGDSCKDFMQKDKNFLRMVNLRLVLLAPTQRKTILDRFCEDAGLNCRRPPIYNQWMEKFTHWWDNCLINNSFDFDGLYHANITVRQLECANFTIAGAICNPNHNRVPSLFPDLDNYVRHFLSDPVYTNFIVSLELEPTPLATPTETVNYPNPDTTTAHPQVYGTENLLQIAGAENTVDVEENADIPAEPMSAPSCAEATYTDLGDILNYTDSLESNDSAVEDGLDDTDEGETGAGALEWGDLIHLPKVFPSANPKSNIYRLCLLEVETLEMAKEVGNDQRKQHCIEDDQITILVFEWSRRHRSLKDKVIDFLLC